MKVKNNLLLVLGLVVTSINLFILSAIVFSVRPTQAAVSGYKLAPILFMASDKTDKPAYLTSINSAMISIQNWYTKQVGTTFAYTQAIKVVSTHPDSYFRCTSGTTCVFSGGGSTGTGTNYSLILSDLDSLLGPTNGKIDRIIFNVGAGSVAVGGGSIGGSGYALLGDGTLEGISGLLTPSDVTGQTGAIAHEIGHSFELPHPDSAIPEYKSLMGTGWINYPNTVINDTLSAPELSVLKKSPYLITDTAPGCTPYVSGHLSITTNTTLCTGVYSVSGGSTGVISIEANNVTLDGSNATFIGAGNYTAGIYGLVINGHIGVTIKNIRFGHFFSAVLVQNSSNVTILDSVFNYNRQTDNNFLGINIGFPGEGGGIIFNNVTNSLVQNNVLNNQNTGIHLFGSSFNKIKNNSASYNKTWGVALNNSTNNIVQQNDTRHVNRCSDGGCDSAGILLVQGSDSNTIEGNNMNYSGDGFFLGNGLQPKPTNNNNTIRNNLADFSPNNGIEATFSSGNIFDSNEVNGNNYAFWLGYSHDGQVINNIIKDNKTNGIDVDRGRNWRIAGNILKNTLNGSGLDLHNSGVIDPNWPGTETSSNYDINNNTFVNNNYGLHLQNIHNSAVSTNNFIANNQNVQFGDITLPTNTITTTNNNLFCLGSGSGPSDLLLNKLATTNLLNTSPRLANDGNTTDPTKSWYIGSVSVGDWWKVDMGSTQTMNAFVVYSWITNYNDIPHAFHIEVSASGSFSGEQTTVASEPDWRQNNTINPRFKIYTFTSVAARYVRIVSDISQNWTQFQEIEAYNDQNITNTYSPNTVCNYHIYNNSPSGTTTNMQSNYWEFSPKANLAVTIYDSSVDATKGTIDYSNQLATKVAVSGDSLNPSLTVNNPGSGANLSGLVNIGVTASDNVRVNALDYYIDGIFLGKVFLSPFAISVDTNRFQNGSHTFTAIATDSSDNQKTVSFSININNSGLGKSGDINGDGLVNSGDLAILLSTWGSTSDLRADINSDGVVNSADLAILLSRWGS